MADQSMKLRLVGRPRANGAIFPEYTWDGSDHNFNEKIGLATKGPSDADYKIMTDASYTPLFHAAEHYLQIIKAMRQLAIDNDKEEVAISDIAIYVGIFAEDCLDEIKAINTVLKDYDVFQWTIEFSGTHPAVSFVEKTKK